MDATARHILYVDYTGPMGDRTHAVGCEASFTSANALDTFFSEMSQAIAAAWSDEVSVSGFRWQELGTDFTIPLFSVTPLLGTNAATFTPNEYPVQWSVSMRSFTSGRKTRSFLYGIPSVPPNDYRWEPGENALADGLYLAYVQACIQGLYVAEDGTQTQPNNYVNARYNSYWQRRYRALT